MSYIHSYSDGVNKPRFASKSDKSILEGHANALDAAQSRMPQYIRSELCRIIESAKGYKDQAYIDRCERIKQDLAGSDEKFKALCKPVIEALIVDAVLQCRIEKGHFDYLSMTKYLKPAFE